MRAGTCWATIFFCLALQGCAGQPSVISRADQASLHALPLFNDDGSARFDFYLSCTGEDASCINVDNAFFDWAKRAQVALHVVDRDDRVFSHGQPLHGSPKTSLPYRIAVQFKPLLMPSFDESGGTHGNMAAGYTPPEVSYTATMQIFQLDSGKLVFSMSAHEQRTADPKADAAGYLRAEVDTFVSSLQPAGSKQ